MCLRNRRPLRKPAHRLSKAEKRVAIAKDVIAQLKVGKYLSSPGIYCYFDETEAAKMNLTKELQKELEKVKSCEVCALGSLFVSDVRKHNNFKVNKAGIGQQSDDECGPGYVEQSISDIVIRERLSKLFSDEQLALIETAFECSEGFNAPFGVESLAIQFGDAFDDPTERMVAIMKNIISNGGKFVLRTYEEMVRESVGL